MKMTPSGAVYFAAQGDLSNEAQMWMKYSCMQTKACQQYKLVSQLLRVSDVRETMRAISFPRSVA